MIDHGQKNSCVRVEAVLLDLNIKHFIDLQVRRRNLLGRRAMTL